VSRLGPTELKRSKYRLLGLIGQGQFGRVFCASHRKTGRLVALKSLDHRRFPTHKFLRELRFLLSLQHPNIVTCQALEHITNGRYLVMDYCEGGTLRNLMEAAGCLDLAQGLSLTRDVLSGLTHAHKKGIVHCDIKPENILLTVQPEGWKARITDFGIARLSQELSLETGATGSPAYMAPERFYGQYSLSSDLYAVGILLYELLVGERPFSGAPGDLMSAHLNNPVKIPDQVPTPLREVILKSLQKLPARRYKSAMEMLEALDAATPRDNSEHALVRLPLGILMSELPRHPFQSQWQTSLKGPLRSLVIHHQVKPRSGLPAELWFVQDQPTGSEVFIIGDQLKTPEHRGDTPQTQVLSGDLNNLLPGTAVSTQDISGAAMATRFSLDHRICRLKLIPGGCLAIAAHSISLLPAKTKTSGCLAPAPEVLANFSGTCLADATADGRWIAAATWEEQGDYTQIHLWQRSPARHQSGVADGLKKAKAYERQSSLQIPKLATPRQLFVLNNRHFVLISGPFQGQQERSLLRPGIVPIEVDAGSGTVFELFNRRGQRLGGWLLAINVAQATWGHRPYQFLALEQDSPHSILEISLKPIKVMRFWTQMQPAFVMPAAWGYLLVNRQGDLQLRDEFWELLGEVISPSFTPTPPPQPGMVQAATSELTVPMQNPKSGLPLADASLEVVTAAALSNDRHLLMATWNDAQQTGNLHRLDLSTLSMGIVF